MRELFSFEDGGVPTNLFKDQDTINLCLTDSVSGRAYNLLLVPASALQVGLASGYYETYMRSVFSSDEVTKHLAVLAAAPQYGMYQDGTAHAVLSPHEPGQGPIIGAPIAGIHGRRVGYGPHTATDYVRNQFSNFLDWYENVNFNNAVMDDDALKLLFEQSAVPMTVDNALRLGVSTSCLYSQITMPSGLHYTGMGYWGIGLPVCHLHPDNSQYNHLAFMDLSNSEGGGTVGAMQPVVFSGGDWGTKNPADHPHRWLMRARLDACWYGRNMTDTMQQLPFPSQSVNQLCGQTALGVYDVTLTPENINYFTCCVKDFRIVGLPAGVEEMQFRFRNLVSSADAPFSAMGDLDLGTGSHARWDVELVEMTGTIPGEKFQQLIDTRPQAVQDLFAASTVRDSYFHWSPNPITFTNPCYNGLDLYKLYKSAVDMAYEDDEFDSFRFNSAATFGQMNANIQALPDINVMATSPVAATVDPDTFTATEEKVICLSRGRSSATYTVVGGVVTVASATYIDFLGAEQTINLLTDSEISVSAALAIVSYANLSVTGATIDELTQILTTEPNYASLIDNQVRPPSGEIHSWKPDGFLNLIAGKRILNWTGLSADKKAKIVHHVLGSGDPAAGNFANILIQSMLDNPVSYVPS